MLPKSIQEEILFVLQSIAAMVAYSLSFTFFAFTFAFLATVSCIGAIYHAVKEIKDKD